MRCFAGDLVRRGELRIVLEDFPIPEQGIYAVWPQSDQLSAKARALVSHLADALDPAPLWDKGLF